MKFKPLLILLLGCAVAYGQPKKIYLSPKAAGAASQSLFIDSLQFYPLESSNEVNLGKYNGLIITDKYFLIGNNLERTLYFFTKAGKYIKKVSYRKIGEQGYPNYDKARQQIIFFSQNKNYALTEKDKIKIKAGFADNRNKKYYKKYIIDLKDSSFSIQKSEPTAFDILNAYNLKDDYYCTYEIAVNEDYKDSIDYEVKIYKGTQFIRGYFPYHKQNEVKYLFAQYIYAITRETSIPNVFYITRPYTDTIYTLSNGILTPIYQLMLPMENTLPASFFQKPFKSKTERENFQSNNGWLLRQIYSMDESDRFILFSIGFSTNYGQYIYDKKVNASYNLSKVKPDSSSYYLPLLNGNNGRQQNKFYTIINPEQLKKVYEQNRGSMDRLPQVLQDCLKDSTHFKPFVAEYVIKNK